MKGRGSRTSSRSPKEKLLLGALDLPADLLDTMSDRPVNARWTEVELREELGATQAEIALALEGLARDGLVEFRGAPLAMAGFYLTTRGIEHLSKAS